MPYSAVSAACHQGLELLAAALKPYALKMHVTGCVLSWLLSMQVVEFLKNPERFTAVGARIPKGVLLVGPPGTGTACLCCTECTAYLIQGIWVSSMLFATGSLPASC